jgi:transcription elongation factor GreA-like protein
MELTQSLVNKLVTEIQSCLGYQVTCTMVQDAYNEYADNCVNKEEPNILLLNKFELTTFTRETLIDVICQKYLGVKCPTFGSSTSEKRTFTKQVKKTFMPI